MIAASPLPPADCVQVETLCVSPDYLPLVAFLGRVPGRAKYADPDAVKARGVEVRWSFFDFQTKTADMARIDIGRRAFWYTKVCKSPTSCSYTLAASPLSKLDAAVIGDWVRIDADNPEVLKDVEAHIWFGSGEDKLNLGSLREVPEKY